MKTCLVAGGGGFIGINLCRVLLEKEYRVIAIDNFITSSKENIQELLKEPNFTFIKHDIVKPLPKSITGALIDEIYDLACPTGVPNLVPLAEEMLLACSLGTRNLLELARKKRAAFLITSSSEVYGDPKVFPQDENYTGNVDTLGARSPYEEGKRFAESLLSMYVKKYGIDGKIVRVFNTYGPYMSPHDTRVIPTFLRQVRNDLPLTITGDGSQTRTFCFVDDLVSGLILVMKKGEKGQVYNLGSNVEVAIHDLAKLFIKVANSNNTIKFVERPAHDHARRLPAIDKVMGLGWEIGIPLETGLSRTLRWAGL